MAYDVINHGIKISKYRRLKEGDNSNTTINSHRDNKTVALNSRDYTTDTGDAIGIQVKPNQTTTLTNRSVKGGEFSPRVSDAGLGSSGALIALTADPVLKAATAGRTVGSVRCIECNPSLPGSGSAYTITNLDGIRLFLDTGAGHTITTKSVIRVATPNAAGWNYFLNLEASSGLFTTATNTVIDHAIPIIVDGVEYWIGVYDATAP